MPPARPEPIRTCVACREEGSKRSLIRVVRAPDGLIAVDPGGRAPGRGAYLHGSQSCIASARKRRALERALGAPPGPDFWTALLPPLEHAPD